jgi:hypothetical protein
LGAQDKTSTAACDGSTVVGIKSRGGCVKGHAPSEYSSDGTVHPCNLCRMKSISWGCGSTIDEAPPLHNPSCVFSCVLAVVVRQAAFEQRCLHVCSMQPRSLDATSITSNDGRQNRKSDEHAEALMPRHNTTPPPPTHTHTSCCCACRHQRVAEAGTHRNASTHLRHRHCPHPHDSP